MVILGGHNLFMFNVLFVFKWWSTVLYAVSITPNCLSLDVILDTL
jgi:hypothetical protein